MNTIMMHAHVSAAELHARGTPENVIRFVETNRSILQRNVRQPVRQSGASGSEGGPYLPLGSYEIVRGDLQQDPQTDIAGQRPQGEASTPERAKCGSADPNELQERAGQIQEHIARLEAQALNLDSKRVLGKDADARGRSGKQETATREASGRGGRADGPAAEFWGEPWNGVVRRDGCRRRSGCEPPADRFGRPDVAGRNGYAGTVRVLAVSTLDTGLPPHRPPPAEPHRAERALRADTGVHHTPIGVGVGVGEAQQPAGDRAASSLAAEVAAKRELLARLVAAIRTAEGTQNGLSALREAPHFRWMVQAQAPVMQQAQIQHRQQPAMQQPGQLH
ncbi:hypothetical protein HWV62_6969 [Athelia sp. TMB]|nr:hypothetical protein HWV62_6969 [Athelia sp. TMB]